MTITELSTADIIYFKDRMHIDICNNRHSNDTETLELMRGSIRLYDRELTKRINEN